MGNQVSYDQSELIKVDKWGGTGGSEWNYKFKSPVKEILIAHGSTIDSIQFRTVEEQGILIDSPRFGGNGGARKDKVIIEAAPLEYLIGIKGKTGDYGGHLVVKSLSFVTNSKIYGPFGSEAGGTPFSLVMKEGGAIVGFHGHSGLYLDAIGVYLNKLSTKKPEADKFEPHEPAVDDIEIYDKMEVMKRIQPRSSGPWGSCSGKGWDDGVFSTIKQVHVHHTSGILGIQIEYQKNDKTSFWSQLHGQLGLDSTKITKIIFDGESEFLIGVEGFYGPDAIIQIAFYTNKGKYGPYGKSDNGTYFSSAAARGKIVGFHGRSGFFLNALGVHMEYF